MTSASLRPRSADRTASATKAATTGSMRPLTSITSIRARGAADDVAGARATPTRSEAIASVRMAGRTRLEASARKGTGGPCAVLLAEPARHRGREGWRRQDDRDRRPCGDGGAGWTEDPDRRGRRQERTEHGVRGTRARLRRDRTG